MLKKNAFYISFILMTSLFVTSAVLAQTGRTIGGGDGRGEGDSINPIPIAVTPEPGTCGTTVNQCLSGSFSDIADDANAHNWSCMANGSICPSGCSDY